MRISAKSRILAWTARPFATMIVANIVLATIFVPGIAKAAIVKEAWDAEPHERKTDLERLVQSKPSQQIRAQIVFHSGVGTEQLAQSLKSSRLQLKKLSYREFPADAEYEVPDSREPAAAFSQVESARRSATHTIVQETKGRLLNQSSAKQDEGKRRLRAAAWAKEDFAKRGVRYLGMEVVGAASDIQSFYQANLFVDTVAWAK